MGSPNELHTFIPLPDNEATQLLSEVVNGGISLAAARKQAEVMIASSKCITTFESAFNSFGGQKHKQRAISKNKWISYDEVVKRFPTIPQSLRSWKQNFQSNKQRLTPVEKKAFESFVGTWYHSYRDSLKVGISAPADPCSSSLFFLIRPRSKPIFRTVNGRLFKVFMGTNLQCF